MFLKTKQKLKLKQILTIFKEGWNENILGKTATWKETAWGSLAHRYLCWAGSLANSPVKHRPDAGKFSSLDQFTEFY